MNTEKVKDHGLTCPECKSPMELKRSRFGYFYGCTRYPNCDCTHGCHQENGAPLGKPANKATRQARIKAHDAFDRIWQETPMQRANAYKWLAKAMGTKGECHIGSLSEEQCKKVIELSEEKLRRLSACHQ